MSWIKNSTVTITNGPSYRQDVYKQHFSNNCTASSMIMLAKLRLNKHIAIGFAQMWIRQAQALDFMQQIDIQANGAINLPNRRGHGWHWNENNGGATLGEVLYAFKQYLPEVNWYAVTQQGAANSVPALLRECSPKKPAFVNLIWDRPIGHQSAHAIVCLGKVFGRDEMMFLDPDNGLVISPHVFTAQGCLRYITRHNSFNNTQRTGVISSAIFS